MIPTSAAYKQAVYNTGDYANYARHFIPYVLLKIIDTKARESCSYSSENQAFYSDTAQLIDGVLEGSFDYGTLEDGQFLLNSKQRLMPDSSLKAGQYGYCSEAMSDADGVCNISITCVYTQPVTTVGRVFYFDKNCDSVPEEFTLRYYKTGVLLQTVNVTGNAAYMYTSNIGVTNYDMLVIQFTKTSKPYRRIHLIEDIPGVYVEYDSTSVISITLAQEVDLFSEELIAGEIDIVVENVSKALDILNPSGYEKYLQRRQPIEIYFKLVFPDETTEAIPVGKMYLVDWKSSKGALSATFTARDAIDTLTLDEYIKGVFPATTASLYELAEDVLIDAGVTDYIIDTELQNIYSSAPLPIAMHKDLLRMIAQAGQSVVLPTQTGGIHVKFVSPLVVSLNNISNSSFESDFTDWTNTGCTLNTAYTYEGKQSCVVSAGNSLSQSITLTAGHIYYMRTYALVTTALSTGSIYVRIADNNVSVNFTEANLATDKWTALSGMYTAAEDTTAVFDIVNTAAGTVYIDSFMLIDLTTTYGSGKEPTNDWCDTNIRFFTTQLAIPRAVEPAAVDTFDYPILLETPEITLSAPVKSVETNIYNYSLESTTSEIYSGIRSIHGTEEFTVKFDATAKNCTITAVSVDSSGTPTATNTATLISSTCYAGAAKLKVSASSDVLITVTGYKANIKTTQYRVDNNMDNTLVADANAKTIDNKLITNKMLAEDVTSYAVFWYSRRYNYEFEWRQNPAVENLDTIVVYDGFDKNNAICLTERNIDYVDGVMGGSSKGVY